MDQTLLRLALATTALMGGTATAEITSRETTGLFTLSAGSFNQPYQVEGPDRVLVIGTYFDGGGGALTGIEFGGVAADGLITAGGRTTLAYFLNPSSDAGLGFTATTPNAAVTNAGYVIWELSGVDLTAGVAEAMSNDIGVAARIGTTVENSLVVNVIGFNPFGGEPVIAPAAGSVVVNPTEIDINAAAGGGWLVAAQGSAPLAAEHPLGWTVSGLSFGDFGELAFAFVDSDPADPDLDEDGLPNDWELANGLDPEDDGSGDPSNGAAGDPDGDGAGNLAEYAAGSDPRDPDSVPGDVDGDGLSDAEETLYFGGLGETPEGDFDQDFVANQAEIAGGTLPNDARDWPDADGDGLNDGWELRFGLDPAVDDALDDTDGDGHDNWDEFLAGSDPTDAAWSAEHAQLRHRWSFTGDLSDSVGGADAQIVDPDADPTFGGAVTQGADRVTLAGGGKDQSEYVLLGNRLLSGLQDQGPVPVTIELWATREAALNWSRVFSFGSDGSPGLDEELAMTWTVGTETSNDRVLWNGRAQLDGTNAPYEPFVPYHVVMTVVPAVFSNGAIATGAEVSWYSAPAAGSRDEGHPLFGAKGSFTVPVGLNRLLDEVAVLGRSMYPDSTAAASYDEVRIWAGTLSERERELFQLLGPDDLDRVDSDDDGFPDAWEMVRFGALDIATPAGDRDGDGDSDEAEFFDESDPDDAGSTVLDSDGDGLDDLGFEMLYFNHLLFGPDDDPDFDYISNLDESLGGTDPSDAESSPDEDGDGLPDGWELAFFFAIDDPDATPDGNPDGDFDDNATEYALRTDPWDEFSGSDSEPDGLPDFWEFTYFGDFTSYGADDDPDGDGVTNLEEFQAFTDPDDPDDFPDSNGDGIPDGHVLVATDGFGNSSFNAGLNWDDGLAPQGGSNYLVSGQTLRTPDVDDAVTPFAGDLLVISNGSLWFKGTNSIASGNLVLDRATVRNAVSAPGPVTLGGSVQVLNGSTLFADNGALVIAAEVTGDAPLTLDGNASAVNSVEFDHEGNDYSGDLTLNPTASLIVNGVLRTGANSVYRMTPTSPGVGNLIGGTGSIELAGTMEIDLSAAAPVSGATWVLLSTSTIHFDESFTVSGAGFVDDGGPVGLRLWTSGDGDYEFDEATGVMSFVGEASGFRSWTVAAGLLAGVEDGHEQDPDGDRVGNVLEYQLGGDPLQSGEDHYVVSDGEEALTFLFDRLIASDIDTLMNFRWSTDLETWQSVPIGLENSGPDANGVTVAVQAGGGASAEYDRVEIVLPKSNAVRGRIFVQLEGLTR